MQKPEVKIEKLDGNEGLFVIEPLEQGFGHTLGNSLRRVLLSSIQGAAITSIKINGVLHEFSTIDGVKEDTTELILNLKKVVVDCKSEEPVKMQLSKMGPGEVLAGDIDAPSEIEIINKDLYLAHLENDAMLEIEMTVKRGRGYLTADENKTGKESIGEIPIDSIFSPVLRVNYEVTATRVGQRTDFDKLAISIRTNGSIPPKDALSQAAKIVNEHMILLIDISEKSEEEKVFEGPEDVQVDDSLPPIEELELSARSFNCLKREGIDTVGKLITYSEQDLLDIKNFGQKSIEEVKEKLNDMGLLLRE
ncbi:MAG: DNA-directed RNA polymerase subunit alpha [Actinobacteria bacterium]|nr:DNA-directed RNA polymerase subunit alpha [Actinomycetota bacterium]